MPEEAVQRGPRFPAPAAPDAFSPPQLTQYTLLSVVKHEIT